MLLVRTLARTNIFLSPIFFMFYKWGGSTPISFYSLRNNLFLTEIELREKNIRVLPDDTDAFGILNCQAAYVRFCEEGEVGLMEMLGFNFMLFFNKRKISFLRRAASFEYLCTVSPDSLIDIQTSVKKIGKTSFTLSHSFFKKTAKMATAFWLRKLR